MTVTSSAPVAYLSAKLCDAFPDGTRALVSRGMLNLAHRDSREDPSPLEPGVPTRVRIPLEVTSWIFDAGHRIRLDLAGSDWPNAWSPPEPLYAHDRPGVGGADPAGDGRTVAGRRATGRSRRRSAETEPSHPGDRPEGVLVWRMEHDVLGRETRAVTETSGWTEARRRHATDLRALRRRNGGVHDRSRASRAPRAPRARDRVAGGDGVGTTTCTISSDRDAYRLEIHLSVAEDGQERWSRDWSRTFPRDHQ